MQNFQKPKEGKKYSFHRMGRGVWKLVDNEVVPKARAKRKPMPVTSTPIIGQDHRCHREIPSFIEKIVEPLKKTVADSITMDVIYRVKK